MDYRILALLMVVPLVAAADVTISGQLNSNSLQVNIVNQVDRDVTFSFKAELKQKTEDWILLEALNCDDEYTIPVGQTLSFLCPYTRPVKPGEYKIYARADVVGDSFTYKEFPFEVTVSEEPLLKLESVSVPETVMTQQPFTVSLRVTAMEDASFDIYSYVYKSNTCYSKSGWYGNSQNYELKKGESVDVFLTDTLKEDTPLGPQQLKVRARFDKDYDVDRTITVEEGVAPPPPPPPPPQPSTPTTPAPPDEPDVQTYVAPPPPVDDTTVTPPSDGGGFPLIYIVIIIAVVAVLGLLAFKFLR